MTDELLTFDKILKAKVAADRAAIKPKHVIGSGYGKRFYTFYIPMSRRLREVGKRMRRKA